MNKICNKCGSSTDVCSITGDISILHTNYIFKVTGTYLSEKGLRECLLSIMNSFKKLVGDNADRLVYDVKCKSCDEKLDSGEFTQSDI